MGRLNGEYGVVGIVLQNGVKIAIIQSGKIALHQVNKLPVRRLACGSRRREFSPA
ncbi:hypothetical protein GCM10023081_46230 [Arthrobacter ginkgonis]|uniref:Uncharacterized protein n=1 Tax=Arthrobacter ginkgonis TaxID=1630594 RepID=A0ABP7DHI3_9MICC